MTNTAISGARLYWEYFGKSYFNVKGVTIPVAVSVFPDELYPAPRSWAEKAYPNLIHFNKLPKGGHFAAWEQPNLFTEHCARVSGLYAASQVGQVFRPVDVDPQTEVCGSLSMADGGVRVHVRLTPLPAYQPHRRGNSKSETNKVSLPPNPNGYHRAPRCFRR